MFSKMRIDTKIITGFCFAILAVLIIGVSVYFSLNSIKNGLLDLAENRLPVTNALTAINSGVKDVTIGERGLINRQVMGTQVRNDQYAVIENGFKEIEENWKAYEVLPKTKEEAGDWNKFTDNYDIWQKEVQNIINLSKQKDSLIAAGAGLQDSRITALDNEVDELFINNRGAYLELDKELKDFISRNNQNSIDVKNKAEKAVTLALLILLICIVVSAGALLTIALAMSKSIKKTFNALISEAGKLSTAAVGGKLDTRGDPQVVDEEFRPIIVGVNETLDAVIKPLNVAAEYVDRISKGDIPPKITDTYKGDFNEIKNNLNTCIDAVNALTADADMLAQAAVAGKFETRADVSIHNGDFQKIVEGVNRTLDVVVDKIFWFEALLDSVPFPVSVTDTDMNWTFINKSVEDMLNIKRRDVLGKNCSNWNSPICRTEECGIAGLRRNRLQTYFEQMGLNFQVDTSYIYNAKGEKVGHIEIIQDITARIKSANYQKVEIDRLGHNLNLLSTGDLNLDLNVAEGDQYTKNEHENFTKINENLAQVKTAIATLVADANMLAVAAVEGKLDTRADAGKHGGDFRKIVEGVNTTLDAVIGPLNVAAEYVDRISKGDIPPQITDKYNGDFNEIKNNLNTCIDAVNALVADANMLAVAAVEGKLDTRADAGKHGGDFRKIVEGVNTTLDAVIGPLNVAAEYVDRISKGDIPPQITDKYNGDFNEIKNNLNTCIDAVNTLVADANMLAVAAVEGKLDTRADAGKHGGDFRKIVEGVNNTLDAVIGPINEAVGCLKEMAQGNLNVMVRSDYKGDHALMKDALNATIDAMNEILSQVDGSVEQVSSGSIQVAESSQELSQGATESASAVQQISSSMHEMESQTNQNAENAIQANQLAVQARDNAEKGNNMMGQMVKAMGDINESASNISKIIKVIDEIAFQTNLLALNAAVEAARAGKHGKGFTVVAEEVRNLAQRSAKAAGETSEMIENSIKKTEVGSKIAEETSKSLGEIVTGATKVTDLISEIAAASKEQAQGITQITQGLGQVDQVIQQNTASSQELAAASEEMQVQSGQLKDMLGRFVLRKQKGGSATVTGMVLETTHNNPRQANQLKKKTADKRNNSVNKATDNKNKADKFIALDDHEFGRF